MIAGGLNMLHILLVSLYVLVTPIPSDLSIVSAVSLDVHVLAVDPTHHICGQQQLMRWTIMGWLLIQ